MASVRRRNGCDFLLPENRGATTAGFLITEIDAQPHPAQIVNIPGRLR
jgi:hypothetical protein